MGGGLADPFDSTVGPADLMLAFAAVEIGRDTAMHHATVDPEPVPERASER